LKKKNAAVYMNIKNALSPCTLGLKIMKSFQQIQSLRALAKMLRELAPISPKVLVFILWILPSQNCSIFKNSCTMGVHIVKPSECTATHGLLSKLNGARSMVGHVW
jgi:hypothetical protein